MNKKVSFLGGFAAGFAGALALRPARTPKVDSDTLNPGAYPVAELEEVAIGGCRQWLLQRGANRDNPLLLYIHGGPGISEMAFNRKYTEQLEQHFVVVQWDQRGAGKSWRCLQHKDKMTIPQFVTDLKEVATYLLKKYHQKQLILVGRSWGSAIGLQAAAQFPELFSAYVGIGQLTDVLKSERTAYQWTLEQAMARDDQRAVKDLQAMGPPPYAGDWMSKFIRQRNYVCRYGGEMVGHRYGSNLMLARSVLFGPEYTLMDKLQYQHCVKSSLRILQPQLMQMNLFETAASVSVPLIFMAGRQDQVVPQSVARQYYEQVAAPQKAWHWFEDSAHMPDVEEPEKFLKIMLETVRPFSS